MRIRTAFALVTALPAVALSLSSASCGGVDVGLEADGGGAPKGSSTSSATSSMGAAAPPQKVKFTAAEVQAAMARCDLPHGPAVLPATWGALRALLVGAWVPCSTNDGGDPATLLAHPIEFAPDGTSFDLLPDGAGGLIRGQGVANQATYSFPTGSGHDVHGDGDPVSNSPWVFVTALSHDETPAGTFEGDLTFETSPSRMYAVHSYENEMIRTWLVSLH